jgi:amidase
MERELWRWDAVELAAAIRSREVSSREAVRSVLGRLDAVNPVINAVTVLLADQALTAADAADALVKREDLCLEAAEVIEAQLGLPTPVDPVR